MGELNIKIWRWIFSTFHFITDNVGFIAIVTAALFGFIIGALSRKRGFFVFAGIPVFVSAAHGLKHLPTTHGLLKTALSTSADIIVRSKASFDAFSKVSGVTSRKVVDVAKYLFYENDADKFYGVSPSEVYEHFFKVKDKILKFLFIDNVAQRSVWLIVIAVFLAVIAWATIKRISFLVFSIIIIIVSCQNAALTLFCISFIVACFSATKWRNKHIINGENSEVATC